MNSLLNQPSAPSDLFEPIEPHIQTAFCGVEPELVACPPAHGSGNENTHWIESPERRQHDGAHIYQLAFNRCGGQNSKIGIDGHSVRPRSHTYASNSNMSRTARSSPTIAARAIMLWPMLSSTICDISLMGGT